MLGDNLKKIREARGMSQEEVAKTLNVSRQAISKWANNRTYPDVENLKLLSQLYEISIDELLNGTSSISTLSQDNDLCKNAEHNNNFSTMLLLLVLLVTSTFVSAIGLIVSITVLIKCVKKKYSPIFYLVCGVCFLINFLNLVLFINNAFLHMGTITIQ